jgi:hypothetical protein
MRATQADGFQLSSKVDRSTGNSQVRSARTPAGPDASRRSLVGLRVLGRRLDLLLHRHFRLCWLTVTSGFACCTVTSGLGWFTVSSGFGWVTVTCGTGLLDRNMRGRLLDVYLCRRLLNLYVGSRPGLYGRRATALRQGRATHQQTENRRGR